MRQLLMLLQMFVVASALRAGSTEELFSAVAAGRLETIRDLLAKGLDVNAVDEEGRTALMNAAESGQSAVASTLSMPPI